jgi:hypothetical protein
VRRAGGCRRTIEALGPLEALEFGPSALEFFAIDQALEFGQVIEFGPLGLQQLSPDQALDQLGQLAMPRRSRRSHASPPLQGDARR